MDSREIRGWFFVFGAVCAGSIMERFMHGGIGLAAAIAYLIGRWSMREVNQ